MVNCLPQLADRREHAVIKIRLNQGIVDQLECIRRDKRDLTILGRQRDVVYYQSYEFNTVLKVEDILPLNPV